ncbi:MAG: hypothetical protein L6Q40_09425 [Azonexus sp.]|nr:hypothetical protein [Azonexus sp.]
MSTVTDACFTRCTTTRIAHTPLLIPAMPVFTYKDSVYREEVNYLHNKSVDKMKNPFSVNFLDQIFRIEKLTVNPVDGL